MKISQFSIGILIGLRLVTGWGQQVIHICILCLEAMDECQSDKCREITGSNL